MEGQKVQATNIEGMRTDMGLQEIWYDESFEGLVSEELV